MTTGSCSPNPLKIMRPRRALHLPAGGKTLPVHLRRRRRVCLSGLIPATTCAAADNSRARRSAPPLVSSCILPRKDDGCNNNRLRGRPPAASLFDFLEDRINGSLDPFPLHPSVDPDRVLTGNFAPVDELPPTPCRVVKGSIPACLRGGAYVRIGPNPRHRPRGPYHLFDGDGMVHSLLLPSAGDDGSLQWATSCSRYVRTQRHAVESSAGGPVFPNLFALRGLAGVARGAAFLLRSVFAGGIDLRMGVTPINANLFLFGDRLLALGDADFPYHVHVSPDDGDVSTVGRWEIDGEVFRGMAAHPKVDPDTGEVFALRYGLLPPFLRYFWFDGDGRKQPDVPITTVPRLSLFHDFAVTENYAVFADSQLVMDPLGMAFGGGGRPMFRFDPAKVPRVGLLPRRARPGDEPRWFEVPGFSPLHVLNAWEDGDGAVVLVAPNWFNMEHLVERMELVHSHMEMVRVDLEKKIVTRTPLSVRNLDLGSSNPAYLGRKCRYAYLALAGDRPPLIKGVAKLDLELAEDRRECVVASREYGPGRSGGEPFFVAKEDGTGGGGGCADEDDGYLVTYVHDENKEESRFVVMDAKSPELETVAEVALPRRVPYGFHGIFLKRGELREQHLQHGHDSYV